MEELLKLVPFINILMAFGIIPLIRNIQLLNTNLEKLGVRLDYIEKDIKSNHENVDRRMNELHDRVTALEKTVKEK
jgi:uncharacterized protein (DUF2164 family)